MMPITQEYIEKMETANALFEVKRDAERAVIDAAVAWRKRETGEHWEYSTLVNAIDRLIALG